MRANALHCLPRQSSQNAIMRRILASIVVIAAVLASGGCATTTPAPIPTELQYQAPTNASESGTIVGSQENSSWADDFTVFVFSVDRKRVVAGRRGWDTPLLLSPGEHRITVAFNRGAFVSAASLMLPVVAGDTFEVRYSTDVAFNGTSSYCDFWIVDKKTGRASTDIVRAPAWRSDRRGYAYVPIYIPKK